MVDRSPRAKSFSTHLAKVSEFEVFHYGSAT